MCYLFDFILLGTYTLFLRNQSLISVYYSYTKCCLINEVAKKQHQPKYQYLTRLVSTSEVRNDPTSTLLAPQTKAPLKLKDARIELLE